MHDCLPSRFGKLKVPSRVEGQTEPAGYRPRAPQALDVPADGLVSKSDREGAGVQQNDRAVEDGSRRDECDEHEPIPQGLPVLRRLGRSSDGAWLKTTRVRRKTVSLHHFSRG
jgi:hypothetical protein